jgi:small subunit ribosomal protein S3Ae
MAKKGTSSRTAARKMKDKWRAKQWYTVRAPEMFDNKEISETLADEPEKILGRIIAVTAQDLTGDFSKMHIKMQFKIDRIHTDSAYTQFIGHDMTSDYIRRLTRRKRSKTDGVFDVETKDKYLVRLKPMALAEKRIQGSQQAAIREIMKKIITTEVRKMTLAATVKSILNADLNKKIVRACKPIYPLKRIEIRKSEILRSPEVKETVTGPKKKADKKEAPGDEKAEEPKKEVPKAEEGMPEEVKEEKPKKAVKKPVKKAAKKPVKKKAAKKDEEKEE